MIDKNEIVLTDDEALHMMITALVFRAREMGHGKIKFKGLIDVHNGKIMQIGLSEIVGTLNFRSNTGSKE